MVYYFLFFTLKAFQALLFHFKGLKDILQHFKFVNWSVNLWFRFLDVTNRLIVSNIIGAKKEFLCLPIM
jgi:hypothetical protein